MSEVIRIASVTLLLAAGDLRFQSSELTRGSRASAIKAKVVAASSGNCTEHHQFVVKVCVFVELEVLAQAIELDWADLTSSLDIVT